MKPVLILGAGVNGCAVARELVLNGVPVTVVDTADIANGATAKSSRLIHGGVRYLEYADFHLVSESLDERERQLKLAPQFVKPLRLHIPVSRRLGGLVQSGFRFLGLTRFSIGRWLSSRLSPWSERGLFTVRFGLWLYDRIARSSLLPGHSVHRVEPSTVPKVDPNKYRWVCSYSDAQMVYPERFVLALLKDARRHSEEACVSFQVLNYHQAELSNGIATIRRVNDNRTLSEEIVREIEPAMVINATGAWGDLTLDQLDIEEKRLFGGTKGSHIITRHRELRKAIGDDGIYAESSDGRLVFILPFGESTLVGTTDLRFEGSPGDVTASADEVQYLVEMVNSVMPAVALTTDDVDAHYCGVRPLPYVPSGKTGSIPRGHSTHTTFSEGLKIITLIGGKLTTWRAFGEEVADRVFDDLGITRSMSTRDLPIVGGDDFPADPSDWCRQVAESTGHHQESVESLFQLAGTESQVAHTAIPPTSPVCQEVPIDERVVDHLIRSEWVNRLEDLVERRLCLVFQGQVSDETLKALADRMVAAGKLAVDDVEESVNRCREHLLSRYGIQAVTPEESEEFC